MVSEFVSPVTLSYSEGDIYHWGTIPATDPDLSGADSVRAVVWTGDNNSSMFLVQAVWLVDGGSLAARRDDYDRLSHAKGYVAAETNPVLIRKLGESHYQGDVRKIEAETQIVSGSVMGEGRSKDDIPPKAVENLVVSKDGVAVRAKWSPVKYGTNNTPELFDVSYVIYSHTLNAYFDPLTEGTIEATVSDTTMLLDDEALRKYYVVLAKDSDNKSDISSRVGKYGFELDVSTKPIYNYLSLPLMTDEFTTANDVANAVTKLDVLYKLNHEENAYTIYYLPQIHYGTNFAVGLGSPLLVSASSQAPEKWFYAGSVPEPNTVVNTLFVPAEGTAYNEIIVPLDKTEITTAKKLANDIGGVEVVLKLNAEDNGFSTFYLPAINYGDNFAIEPGEPVLINVNNNAPPVWPNPALLSSNVPVETEPKEQK